MTFTDQMDKAAESSFTKLAFRLGTPVALLVGGWYFAQMNDGMKELTDGMNGVKSDIRYVNARIDERVIRNIDAQARRLDNHDDRLRVIETDVQVLKQSVRTP